ncbi:NTP transferase domain-containing protein [Halobaculum sp. P14]|uniref:NTP transferase domain-containing protein n=1 Tax=Halobaculum sp. P14 TaxID=3421638 RepID=UPI003EBA2D3D
MTVNVIPMAGLGSRFSTEGYLLPKPLIPVSGEPMIRRVVEDLPDADKWVFVVRAEHVDDYGIDSLLESTVEDAEVVTVSETTEGQVCTAMLAEPHLDPDEDVLIAACDHGLQYDEREYRELRSREDVDAVVWTFTEQRALEQHPESWGWCAVREDGETVDSVSVKTPISSSPYDDHAVTGAFYFDRAEDFIEAATSMVEADHRVNGEFYADTLPVFLNRMGKRSVVFDVDLYISWGTPDNLYRYEELEYLCRNAPASAQRIDELTDNPARWREYFDD